MNFDAERALLSCLREEDDDSYKGFAYALEQGITNSHFTDEGCKTWWNAIVEVEKEGKMGMIEVLQKVPKDFFSQYPNFNQEVLNAHEVPTFNKAKVATDELVKSRNFKVLHEIGENLTFSVQDANRSTDPIDLAVSAEKELQGLIKPKSSTLKGSDDLTSATIAEIRKTLSKGPARIEPNLPWLKQGLDGGFKDGHLVVVAARPSVGKTTLVLNFVHNAALQGKKDIILFLGNESRGFVGKIRINQIKGG